MKEIFDAYEMPLYLKIFFYLVIVFFILLVGSRIYLGVQSVRAEYSECLIQEATNYCESINQIYFKIAGDYAGDYGFRCREDIREFDSKEFLFTKQELKECGF